jgi:dTDP-4-dehydrorhamnose reductase
MRLLILGADGMFGHTLWDQAMAQGFEVFGTVRRIPEGAEHLFEANRIVSGVDAEHDDMTHVLGHLHPQVAVNCIGVVKQSPTISDPVKAIRVNSIFPHLLARSCSIASTRLIHLSTDCVFSGRRGRYTESDPPDPIDFYGMTKLMGEPHANNVLVLRTSMYGFELDGDRGLLEWFVAQRGKTVKGFTNAIFSGFYTRSLARLILQIASKCPSLNGLRHLSATPISKYELLRRIRDACHLPIKIIRDRSVRINRSLDSGLIRNECHLRIPPHEEMINEVAEDLKRRE